MIKVNGESFDNFAGMSVAELLKTQNYPDKMIAIECNGSIVPRKTWSEYRLKDGDCVEIVRFVGGG